MGRVSAAVLGGWLCFGCGGDTSQHPRGAPPPGGARAPDAQQGGPADQQATERDVPLSEAPAGNFWSWVNSSAVFDTKDTHPVAVGGAFCRREKKKAIVECVDAATGKPSLNMAALPGAGRLVGGSLLTEVVVSGGKVRLRSFSGPSPVLDTELSLDATGFIDGGRVLPPEGGRALVMFSRKQTRKEQGGARVVAVDVKRGTVLGQVDLEGTTRHVGESAELAFFVSNIGPWGRARTPHMHAIERASGKVRWSRKGSPRERWGPPSVQGKTVSFTDDRGSLVQLDAVTGKQLRKVSLGGKRPVGNVAPLGEGTSLYVVGPKLLRVEAGKVASRAPDLGWIRQLLPLNDVLAVRSEKLITLVDKQSLQPLRRFPSSESWTYGEMVRTKSGLGALVSFRYNYDYQLRVDHFRKVASGTALLSQLPDGTRAYERGQLLGAGSAELAQGTHQLDLLRPGHAPSRVRVSVAGGTSVSVAAASAPTKPVAAPRGEQLWASTQGSLKPMLSAPTREIPYAVKLSGSTVYGQGTAISVSKRDGLRAIELATGAQRWSIPAPDLLQQLAPNLPEDDVKRRLRLEAVAVDPESQLAIVVTEGVLESRFAAYDLTSGQPKWNVPTRVVLPHMSTKGSAYYRVGYRIAHGMLWHRDERQLFGRSLATGELLFERLAPGSAGHRSSPLFLEHNVYYIFDDELRALRLFDQKLLWSTPVPKPAELFAHPSGQLIVVGQSQVFAISPTGQITAKSGLLQGNVDDNAPLFTDQHVIVCGHFRNQVYALKWPSLARAWTFSERSGASPCPTAVSSSGEVLLSDGTLGIIVSLSTGKEIARSNSRGRGSPRITAWQQGRELCLPTYDRANCWAL